MEFETKGKIARIRKDRKGLDLGFDNWFNSFKKLPDEFKVGDEVLIVSIEKKVNNKIFKNIKSIKKIETKIEPEWSKLIDSNYSDEIKPFDDKLTPTDKNAILIVSKDIYLEEQMLEENPRTLKQIISEVKELRLKI